MKLSRSMNAKLRMVMSLLLVQSLFMNCSGGFKSAGRTIASTSSASPTSGTPVTADPVTPIPLPDNPGTTPDPGPAPTPDPDPATLTLDEKAALVLKDNRFGADQWYLVNTGQRAYSRYGGTAGEDLNMKQTLVDGVKGAGIRIAICDTGTLMTHEVFSSNALYSLSRNYKQDYLVTGTWTGDPTPDLTIPGEAHGTAVASLAAGATGTMGIRGMAPAAKFGAFYYIPAISLLTSRGYYTSAKNSQVTGTFDIFNHSFGYPQCTLINTSFTTSTQDAFLNAVATQRSGKGSLIVKSAGNDYTINVQKCVSTAASSTVMGNSGYDPHLTTPYTINVGAVDAQGYSSQYSSPGANLWITSAGGEYGMSNYPESAQSAANSPALIAADFVGCNVGRKTNNKAYSGFDAGNSPNEECKYSATMNGTSGAAPILSGAIALMLEVNPNLTWRDVKYILAKTADKPNLNESVLATHPISSRNLTGHVYENNWVTNSAGFHFHNFFGFGRVNVDKAVAMSKNFVSPLGTFKSSNWADDTGDIALNIPDGSAAGVARLLTSTQNLTLEAVQMRVNISGCSQDVGVEITSPAGTKSIVMNINSGVIDGAIDHVFLSNAFYGEKSVGDWIVKVVDGKATCTAQLTRVRFNFFGY